MESRPVIKKTVDTVNPRVGVTISIPPGWFTNISAISRKRYPQLVSITSSLDGGKALEAKFVSLSHVAMHNALEDGEPLTFPINARDTAIDLVFAFYNASKSPEKEPLTIEHSTYASAGVNINESSNTGDISPDYHTFLIFVEDTVVVKDRPVEQYDDLAVTVYLIKADPKPTQPPSRPREIQEYLKHYDTAFLIDDSASMKRNDRWEELKKALCEFSSVALSHDISLFFLNSNEKFLFKNEIRGGQDVLTAMSKVEPQGHYTPTGKRVAERMLDFLATVDRAAQTGYSHIKPLDLICFTDGHPNDEDPEYQLEKVLVEMSAAFFERKHHPGWMSIKFVQIGADADARDALVKLTYLRTGGMVRTFPYDKSGSEISVEKIEQVLLA